MDPNGVQVFSETSVLTTRDANRRVPFYSNLTYFNRVGVLHLTIDGAVFLFFHNLLTEERIHCSLLHVYPGGVRTGYGVLFSRNFVFGVP